MISENSSAESRGQRKARVKTQLLVDRDHYRDHDGKSAPRRSRGEGNEAGQHEDYGRHHTGVQSTLCHLGQEHPRAQRALCSADGKREGENDHERNQALDSPDGLVGCFLDRHDALSLVRHSRDQKADDHPPQHGLRSAARHDVSLPRYPEHRGDRHDHRQDGCHHVDGAPWHAVFGFGLRHLGGHHWLGAVPQDLALLFHPSFGLAHRADVPPRDDHKKRHADGENGVKVERQSRHNQGDGVGHVLSGEESDYVGAPGIQGNQDAFRCASRVDDVTELLPGDAALVEQWPGHRTSDQQAEVRFQKNSHADKGGKEAGRALAVREFAAFDPFDESFHPARRLGERDHCTDEGGKQECAGVVGIRDRGDEHVHGFDEAVNGVPPVHDGPPEPNEEAEGQVHLPGSYGEADRHDGRKDGNPAEGRHTPPTFHPTGRKGGRTEGWKVLFGILRLRR